MSRPLIFAFYVLLSLIVSSVCRRLVVPWSLGGAVWPHSRTLWCGDPALRRLQRRVACAQTTHSPSRTMSAAKIVPVLGCASACSWWLGRRRKPSSGALLACHARLRPYAPCTKRMRCVCVLCASFLYICSQRSPRPHGPQPYTRYYRASWATTTPCPLPTPVMWMKTSTPALRTKMMLHCLMQRILRGWRGARRSGMSDRLWLRRCIRSGSHDAPSLPTDMALMSASFHNVS